MSRASFRRPDGREGTFGEWAAERAAMWNALSAAEKTASRDAAAARLASQVKAEAGGPALMHLYDEIGWFGVWPADVVEALGGIKGDVEVHLNSPGGNVFDGLAIYAALKEHKGQVGVVVDGLAASAASFIAMAAAPGKLEVAPNGTVMIHDAWGMCVGDAKDMADTAAILEQQSQNIASIYASRGGKTAPEYRDLMRAETWAVGQEAVDLRLADRVRKAPAADAGPPPAPAATWQVTVLAAAAPDRCCDQCGPDCQCMTPQDHARHHVRNAAADESAWDGSAAMSAAAGSDDPAAAYKAICAGRREGDPGKQSSWALPHHKHPGDPPNRAGVNNAMARFSSTQGLANEAAARAHLEAHQAAMGGGDTDNRAGMPAWLAKALTAKEAANR